MENQTTTFKGIEIEKTENGYFVFFLNGTKHTNTNILMAKRMVTKSLAESKKEKKEKIEKYMRVWMNWYYGNESGQLAKVDQCFEELDLINDKETFCEIIKMKMKIRKIIDIA